MNSRTRVTRALTGLAGLALAASALTACGASDAEHNDADVAFATEMIPHHAQAVDMAEMVDGKDVDPEVAALASEIEDAQGPEIETMSGWLEDWDEPVPEAGAMESMDMTGMMSPQDMADLESAEGAEFQTMWLEMMVEHHQGAIEMAQAEQSEGEASEAIDLAEEIESAQSEEITVMDGLLSSS